MTGNGLSGWGSTQQKKTYYWRPAVGRVVLVAPASHGLLGMRLPSRGPVWNARQRHVKWVLRRGG